MSNEAGLSLAGAHADSAVDLVAGTIRELLHELHRALAVHLQVLVSVAEVFEAALAIAAVEEVDSEAVAEAAVAASEEVEGTAVWDMEDQTAHHPDHVKEEDSEEAETTVAHQEAAADETMQTSSLSHQEEATTAEEVEATVIETETSAVAQRGHSRGATMTHDKDDATNGSMERGKILPTNHSTPKGKYTDRCSSWQPLTLQVASSWTRWDVLYTPCTSLRSHSGQLSSEVHFNGESDYLLKGKVPARAQTTILYDTPTEPQQNARWADRISGGSVFLLLVLLLLLCCCWVLYPL